MAWTAPKTFVANVALTAAELNTHLRDNLLETCPATVTTAGDLVYADAANSMGSRLPIGVQGSLLTSSGSIPVWRRPIEDAVNGTDTTTSTTYVDYDFVANFIQVTATTGTHALIHIEARVANNTAGASTNISYRVSGATTIAASDNFRATFESSAANDQSTITLMDLNPSLTAGSNVFTLAFKASSGTASIFNGRIIVIPLS